MSWVRTIFAITIISALAACRPQAPADRTPPVFQPPPNYELSFNGDGAAARLTFGAPDSDDLQLVMGCYKGSGRIMATDLWQKSAEVTVSSGQARMSFSGKTSQNLEGDGSQVDFWARPSDPPLAAFRSTGELTLKSGIKVLPIKAKPDEMPSVEAFFAACEKPSAPALPERDAGTPP